MPNWCWKMKTPNLRSHSLSSAPLPCSGNHRKMFGPPHVTMSRSRDPSSLSAIWLSLSPPLHNIYIPMTVPIPTPISMYQFSENPKKIRKSKKIWKSKHFCKTCINIFSLHRILKFNIEENEMHRPWRRGKRNQVLLWAPSVLSNYCIVSFYQLTLWVGYPYSWIA